LANSTQALLEPRKSPVQARSIASVEAILDATIQVLLNVGRERLTTTRVAARAGVSVGTLYQYFPNKKALLQATLRRHLDDIAQTIERVCREQKKKSLEEMATALVTAFLEAKMRDPKTSVALYSVSGDVDGAKIARQNRRRASKAIVEMLMTADEPLVKNPEVVAEMLYGTMAGVSRSVLEADHPREQLELLRHELVDIARAYLRLRVSWCTRTR
jgi:AcrR family transcriptional regulator